MIKPTTRRLIIAFCLLFFVVVVCLALRDNANRKTITTKIVEAGASPSASPQPNYPYGIEDVTTIEGCEYFVQHVGSTFVYSHKGNCKNPIHWK